MLKQGKVFDAKLLYVACSNCNSIRQKVNGKFNILKRGKERNGIARFFCLECKTWFNEKTGESMQWRVRS